MNKKTKVLLKVVAFCLAITLLLLFLPMVILLVEATSAQENLMQSNGAKESIILNHNNGIIDSVTLRYEWSD